MLAVQELLALPCGGDLAGRVDGGEQRVEPSARLIAEAVPSAQEELAVGPGGVCIPAAAAVAVAAHPLADVGDHLVGEHHHVEVVHDDPGAGQCPPDP